MRIGINIDGVINNMNEFLQDYASKYIFENGLTVTENVDAYDTINMFSWGIKNDSDFVSKYIVNFYDKILPRRFASQVIKSMKKENNDIFIICPIQSFGIKNTKENIVKWLDKNKIVYDRIIYDSQDNIINWAENSVDILIDDKPDFIRRLAFKKPVICYNNRYNEDCNGKNIYRAYGWYDVYSKIHKFNNIFD